MHFSSTYKLLFLLNMLSEGEYSKNEIIEKFKKNGIPVAKSSITKYINEIISNDIKINIKINSKREKVYCLENKKPKLNISKEELKAISDLKKMLVLQKNPTRIRKTMRLFYKLARFIDDEDVKLEFINFGYYSTLNWNLFRQLEQHCKEKNLITIDYILPVGQNKEITIHVDKIEASAWSEKLYLHGVFKNGRQFSNLPIDRIFAIKKIERKNLRFNLVVKTLTYIVDLNTYKGAIKDNLENIVEIKNNRATIKRPIDDEFYIVQRLLYFCPDIFYISDERIKKLYMEKLESLEAIYDKRIDK